MSLPTWVEDQRQAAAAHARNAVTAAGRVHGLPVVACSLGGPLAALWRRHTAAIEAGEGLGCRHLGAAPSVVHAAAHRPGIIVCTACAPMLRGDDVEEHTCDVCREHHPGKLWAAIVVIGVTLFSFGVCRSCAPSTLPPMPRRNLRGWLSRRDRRRAERASARGGRHA